MTDGGWTHYNMNKSNLDLEPKVTKLETEIVAITREISTLGAMIKDVAANVQRNSDHVSTQIQQLVVAVTTASGPRKTDWSTLIAAGFLILALAGLAYSPLKSDANTTAKQVEKMESDYSEHKELTLHPVGASKVDALEKTTQAASIANALAIKDLDTKLQKEFTLLNEVIKEQLSYHSKQILSLDEKLQKEFFLAEKNTHERVESLKVIFDEVRLNGSPAMRERFAVLEERLQALDKRSSIIKSP